MPARCTCSGHANLVGHLKRFLFSIRSLQETDPIWHIFFNCVLQPLVGMSYIIIHLLIHNHTYMIHEYNPIKLTYQIQPYLPPLPFCHRVATMFCHSSVWPCCGRLQQKAVGLFKAVNVSWPWSDVHGRCYVVAKMESWSYRSLVSWGMWFKVVP